MPLHLLGKKSWNVYNPANIERVRRDEAEVAAKEAAEEQRMQEEDAHRRLQLLRGVSPSSLEPLHRPAEVEEQPEQPQDRAKPGHERKRRKLRGEDDTDRDIRYAKETQDVDGLGQKHLSVAHKSSDAPIVDNKGHIALFTPETKTTASGKESRSHGKSKTVKDDTFKQLAGEAPWYSTSGTIQQATISTVGKDAWGNNDPRRKERDMTRLAANDPLLAMTRGVQGVRQAQREKKRLNQERDQEISKMIEEERRKDRKKRHAEHWSHHHRRTEHESQHRDRDEEEDAGSLEDFRLDDPKVPNERSKERRHRDHSSREERDRRRRRHH